MPHRVSAVLLAAGSSRRMGKPKQLLPLGDRPVVVRCLESIQGAGVDDIVVVVGPSGHKVCSEIIAAVGAFPVSVARNEMPDADMSQSVRTGLAKVDPAASSVFICLADQPLVKAGTLANMIRCHEERPGMIIIPVYKGKKGHPPLLPAEVLSEIHAVQTLRDLIEKHSEKVYRLEVADEGVVLDMDTWEDYQRFIAYFTA